MDAHISQNVLTVTTLYESDITTCTILQSFQHRSRIVLFMHCAADVLFLFRWVGLIAAFSLLQLMNEYLAEFIWHCRWSRLNHSSVLRDCNDLILPDSEKGGRKHRFVPHFPLIMNHPDRETRWFRLWWAAVSWLRADRTDFTSLKSANGINFMDTQKYFFFLFPSRVILLVLLLGKSNQIVTRGWNR